MEAVSATRFTDVSCRTAEAYDTYTENKNAITTDKTIRPHPRGVFVLRLLFPSVTSTGIKFCTKSISAVKIAIIPPAAPKTGRFFCRGNMF